MRCEVTPEEMGGAASMDLQTGYLVWNDGDPGILFVFSEREFLECLRCCCES